MARGERPVLFGGYSLDREDVIEFSKASSNCRLTNMSIKDYNHPTDSTRWVSLSGENHRVDHCSFSGKNFKGATLAVWLDSLNVPDNHLIDHNYFGPRPYLNGVNGGESIRIGAGPLSAAGSSYTKVSYNIFGECDGEGEAISLKSSNNIINHNLLYKCRGAITCRQGQSNTIADNYFIGNSKANTGGVRLTGKNHIVKRNYLQHLKGRGLLAAISVMNGEVNPDYAGYTPVKGAVIQSNVLVNCRENFYIGSGNRTVPPDSLNISSNYLINPDTLWIANSIATNSVIANNRLYGHTLIPGFITMINSEMVKADKSGRSWLTRGMFSG